MWLLLLPGLLHLGASRFSKILAVCQWVRVPLCTEQQAAHLSDIPAVKIE